MSQRHAQAQDMSESTISLRLVLHTQQLWPDVTPGHVLLESHWILRKKSLPDRESHPGATKAEQTQPSHSQQQRCGLDFVQLFLSAKQAPARLHQLLGLVLQRTQEFLQKTGCAFQAWCQLWAEPAVGSSLRLLLPDQLRCSTIRTSYRHAAAWPSLLGSSRNQRWF